MAFRDTMATADQTIVAALCEPVALVTGDGINLGNVTGLFEEQYVEVLNVEGMRPTFTARTADLPQDPHDCELTYDGKTYRVVTPQPDGTGMTLLVLEEQ